MCHISKSGEDVLLEGAQATCGNFYSTMFNLSTSKTPEYQTSRAAPTPSHSTRGMTGHFFGLRGRFA